MHTPFDFDGKIALVCGVGTGGIGAPTAALLCDGGAKIVAVDYTRESAEATCALIAGRGGTAIPYVADLRDRAATGGIVDFTRSNFGHLDLIVNVAGGTKRDQNGPIETTDFEAYDDIISLNLTYVFQICRDAAPLMIEGGGGAIVNIASVSGLTSAPFHAIYGAAKAGLMSLTRSMAVEWGRFGIRANAVAPGSVETARALASGIDMASRARDWSPLGKPVQAEDIANAAAFLLSARAKSITGQTIIVDSGISARSPIGGVDYLGLRFAGPSWNAD